LQAGDKSTDKIINLIRSKEGTPNTIVINLSAYNMMPVRCHNCTNLNAIDAYKMILSFKAMPD